MKNPLKQLTKRIPFERVNWITSSFLMGTLLIALTCVPIYIWHYGIDWVQISLFVFFYVAAGLSISMGYHRLFSHLAFKAKLPLKLFVLIFGATAFENSVFSWVSDHRRHHKHVDGDEDPYDITKGFWHAHMGWMLFKLNPEPPMDNVKDLEKDSWVMWQHRWVHAIAIGVGFGLPTLIGWLHGGPLSALGAFLIGGVARVVLTQQSTFCINSVCHSIGKQPYSSRCSARDSWVSAIATFGEGYHNFHHEFQHDYRNGVKPWQFDPTKWAVSFFSKIGLTSDLRRVSQAKILLAEVTEARSQVDRKLERLRLELLESTSKLAKESQERIHALSIKFNEIKDELQSAIQNKVEVSREALNKWKEEINQGLKILEETLSAVKQLS